MGIFSRKRPDEGRTFDGQGEERNSTIDRIKYNGYADDLVWKYPYDNISIGAQLIVNESQEAIFVKGGAVCDVFGPGTHTLSANNLPLLQRIVNLTFGKQTPFTAEIWYVNKTVKRNLGWGTATPIKLPDPKWKIFIPVSAYGEYGVRIKDSYTFVKELVGTLHAADTDDVEAQFRSLIITKTTDTISNYINKKQISIIEIPTMVDEISNVCKSRVIEEFERYGIEVTNFYVESISYPDNDPGVIKINEQQAISVAQILQAEANKMQRDIEGYTYQQERSFDVLESAAGNEGSGSSDLMGAGIGMGMGFGLGGAFGAQMGGITSNLNTGNNPATPPPPPTTTPVFHVLIDGAQQGPFEMEKLKQFVSENKLVRDTYVWKQGMAQWTKASECIELQALFAAVPPPPPPGL